MKDRSFGEERVNATPVAEFSSIKVSAVTSSAGDYLNLLFCIEYYVKHGVSNDETIIF